MLVFPQLSANPNLRRSLLWPLGIVPLSMASTCEDGENRPIDPMSPQTSARAPLHQHTNSMSRHIRSPTKPSTSIHVASPRYVHQYRDLMDKQRQTFDEERALWHTERTELQEKIFQLEASLHRYQAISSSQVSSPIEANGSEKSHSFSPAAVDESRHTSTGDEFWRGSGGKSNARPKRTFSDSSNQSLKMEDRLPIISEDPNPHKPKAASFPIDSIGSGSLRKAGIRGIGTDKNLDGITFRKSSLAPSISESLTTPQPSLSNRSPSPTRVSPGSITIPPFLLTEPDDPYTKDAGHTPLARRSQYNPDGKPSALSSGLATPTEPEVDRPPLEPRASAVKVPSERTESYFPNLEEDMDGDVELQWPLGLKNDKAEDKTFLNELDSKLLQAARSKPAEPPERSESDKENVGEDKSFIQPEPEPKLRIKRSMNFGSQLGAANCGKGF